MKKIIAALAIIVGSTVFATQEASAQVNINVNVGNPSMRGGGAYGNYCYIPDLDIYFDMAARDYVYYSRGQWMHANRMPRAYRNYDMNNCYRVAVNGRTPWMYNGGHRQQYGNYGRRGYNNQGYGRYNQGNGYAYEHTRHHDHDGYRDDNRGNDRYDNRGYGNNNDRDNRGNSGDRGNRGGRW
jgi:hypothetical protein